MRLTTQNLLKDADRTTQSVAGWLCALISVVFSLLFVWVLYLVAWRNPRQYDVHDLEKGSTLAIFGLLLAIAGGFGTIAFRLITRRRANAGLLSPWALRLWGALFTIGTAVAMIHAILTRQWLTLPHFWSVLTGTCSMAVAAFALARIRQQSRNSSQQDVPPNSRPPSPIPAVPEGQMPDPLRTPTSGGCG